MDPAAEGEVAAAARTLRIEEVGMVESRRIHVGGAEHDDELRVLWQIDAAERHGPRRPPQRALQRRIEPQQLLDERLDSLGVGSKSSQDLGVLRHPVNRAAQRVRRGLVAGDENLLSGTEDFPQAELLPQVRLDQQVDDVVSRLVEMLLEDSQNLDLEVESEPRQLRMMRQAGTRIAGHLHQGVG